MPRLVLPLLALACAAAQPPAFEVASIKLSEPLTPDLVQSGRLHIGIAFDASYVRISQYSMFELLTFAYQVKPHQISGPDWMTAQRYDIQAKLPDGASRAQVAVMVQTLLAERFGLAIHHEARPFSVYALTVAPGGPHLKPTSQDAAPPVTAQIRGGTSVDPGGAIARSGPDGSSRVIPGPGGNLHVETKRMNMVGLANLLNPYCERPVVDATGLAGAYDFEFEISAEELRNAARAHGANLPPSAPGETAADPAGVSLPSSLRKLGLRLETRKASADVVVVDKVERFPSKN